MRTESRVDQDAPARRPRLALVDGASFVLPYDHGLAQGLAERGWQVTLFASRTRYNAGFAEALRAVPGARVELFDVSGTVAGRVAGVFAYARLCWRVWRRRAEFDAVNLQFSIVWPLEWLLALALGRRFVLTLHNAVPHGFAGRRHAPTAALIRRAARVVCPSAATLADARTRYGALPHAHLLAHGLLPTEPGRPPRRYVDGFRATALVFWGNVMPYKGAELLLELARSPTWQRHAAAAGMTLEVHGAFAPTLAPLRDELQAAGVQVVDRFLDAGQLNALLARPVLFVLPYHRASQSGALYTLLHEGCRFLCSDVGDLGALLRTHGLERLLLQARTAEAVLAALQRLDSWPDQGAAAFAAAQQAHAWPQLLAGAAAAYGLRESQP